MDHEEQELRFAAMIEALEQEHARVLDVSEKLTAMPGQLRQAIQDAAREAAQSAVKSVRGDIERAREVVVAIQRLSLWRAALQHAIVALVAILITLGAVWTYVPSKSEIESLRAERTALQSTIDTLAQRGGRLKHSECGKRFCVMIDEAAGRFGNEKKHEIYMIAKGY